MVLGIEAEAAMLGEEPVAGPGDRVVMVEISIQGHARSWTRVLRIWNHCFRTEK